MPANPLVRTIRHMLNRLEDNPALCWADQDFTVNPDLDRGFWTAREIWSGLRPHVLFEHDAPPWRRLRTGIPNTLMVLEHTGMPHDHSADGRKRWRAGMHGPCRELRTSLPQDLRPG